MNSDKLLNGTSVLGITGNSNNINTTVGSVTSPTYSATNFTENTETGYWLYDSELYAIGEITMTIDLPSESNLVLSYKGTRLSTAMSGNDVYLDNTKIGSLVSSSELTTYTINSVSSGTHTVKVCIDSDRLDTTLEICMQDVTIISTPITANTVLSGSTGFVNGQKIVGTYVPTIVNEYNSIAAMEADTTAVANHTYGIEKRTRPIYTYTPQEYNSTVNSNTGFYCLDILESFITSSTITSNSYQSLSDYNNNIDFTYSELSLLPTSAEIKIVDYNNNNVLIDAIYASQDGENYTLTSLTGNNVDQTTYKFYLENGHIQMSRNRGEGPTPSYSDLFNDFFKPQIRTQGQETYNGALYLYNGSTWDKLIDQDN